LGLTDRGWIAVTIAIFVAAVIGTIMVIAPRTRRGFFIAGLSLALLFSCGLTFGSIFRIVSHRQYHFGALIDAFVFCALAWSILRRLVEEFRSGNVDANSQNFAARFSAK
jgi:hypothetical protein